MNSTSVDWNYHSYKRFYFNSFYLLLTTFSIHDMRDTHYVILGKQFQFFDYTMNRQNNYLCFKDHKYTRKSVCLLSYLPPRKVGDDAVFVRVETFRCDVHKYNL